MLTDRSPAGCRRFFFIYSYMEIEIAEEAWVKDAGRRAGIVRLFCTNQ